MKLMKRSGIYKAKNVTFNPKTLDAHSYDWWRFVALVEGKVIFNSYRYSVSTARHQRKVGSLLASLDIKIDIDMPLPRGIRNDQTLAELIIESEEFLCEQFLAAELKRDERNDKARVKRLKAKLTEYLETEVHFRDYLIAERSVFGNPNNSISTKCAVHQCIDANSLANDVANALHSFHRDGFGEVIFYV